MIDFQLSAKLILYCTERETLRLETLILFTLTYCNNFDHLTFNFTIISFIRKIRSFINLPSINLAKFVIIQVLFLDWRCQTCSQRLEANLSCPKFWTCIILKEVSPPKGRIGPAREKNICRPWHHRRPF